MFTPDSEKMSYKLLKSSVILFILFPSASVLADAIPDKYINLWRDAEKQALGIAGDNVAAWQEENMPRAKVRMKEYCTQWTGCEGAWVRYELLAPGNSRQTLECPTEKGHCVALESDVARPAGSI